MYVVNDEAYCYRAAELHSVTRADGFKPDDGQLLHVEEIDADVVTRPPFSLPAPGPSDEDEHRTD